MNLQGFWVGSAAAARQIEASMVERTSVGVKTMFRPTGRQRGDMLRQQCSNRFHGLVASRQGASSHRKTEQEIRASRKCDMYQQSWVGSLVFGWRGLAGRERECVREREREMAMVKHTSCFGR